MKKIITIAAYLISIIFLLISPALQAEVEEGNSPVTFLQNRGQWSSEILYQGTSTVINVYFLNDGLSFAQTGEEFEDSMGEEQYPFLVWNMKFINPNPGIQVTGQNMHESKISYLYGNDSTKWVIHPPEYSELSYNNIYHSIDLDFYGNENNLKYDYIIHPGGDIHSITTYFEGIEFLSINDNGELEIITEWGMQLQRMPYAYQMIDNIQQQVEVKYMLLNDTTFGFAAGNSYNYNYDLVIDPLFEFVWCSYTKAIGASDNRNYSFSNAMDASGNVYLTGMVDGTYPITPGAYSDAGMVDPEIFVSKFSADGTTMIYSTYISGSSDEMGLGIAVDALGQANVVGHAMTNWTGTNTYPTTASAYQPVINPGGYDAILTVLNATGTGLVYSTFLGGSGDDEAYAVALGTTGLVYITGHTYSWGTTFPTKGTSMASQQSAQGYHDAFVAKFDITKTGAASLIYSIHLGGGGDDYSRSIAVNDAGNAYVTGRFQAISPPGFPTTAGVYNTTYSGGSDNMMAFVTKLSATTPVTYSHSTYIAPGAAHAIAVDAATNEAYIVGSTNTFAFPTTAGVLQSVHGQDAIGNPNADAFVVKLNATATTLVYSTFLGGPWSEGGTGLAVNSAGEAYVSGTAYPLFPTSAGALQPNHATGGYDLDFFVVHLNSDATDYGCGGSTYIGGNDNDYGTMMYDYSSPKVSIRNHDGINDTISVSGTSHSTNFPTTAGSYGPVKVNGISDQPVFLKLTCFVLDPLYVKITSFSGVNEKDKNILDWATASEINNSYFIIERSEDGNGFTEIGKVSSTGNTTQLTEYSFVDENPLKGVNYYRLLLVSITNEMSYSQIIAVNNEGARFHCFVYADETSGNYIFSCSESEHLEAQLFTINGNLVEKINVSDNTSYHIKMNGYSSGLYILRIEDGDRVQNFKLLKH